MLIGRFFPGVYQFRASAIALILANLVPLLGVVFLRWDAFSVVVLYWIENVIIGAINVLKMIACSPTESSIDWTKFGSAERVAAFKKEIENAGAAEKAQFFHHGAKFSLVPFFAFHYGFFCLVHGIFVFMLFGRDSMDFGLGPFGPLSEIFTVFSEEHLWWGVIALAGSHLYSFFTNFIGHGEYHRTLVVWQMFQPYTRVVVLHVAILFGGFIATALGSNLGVLVILVVAKTALDLHFHLVEHVVKSPETVGPVGPVLDEAPA